jgi:hypothetical protein
VVGILPAHPVSARSAEGIEQAIADLEALGDKLADHAVPSGEALETMEPFALAAKALPPSGRKGIWRIENLLTVMDGVVPSLAVFADLVQGYYHGLPQYRIALMSPL